MIYTHRFQVNAPLSAVVKFHQQSASMGSITPPPIIVRMHEAPALLAEGDHIDFTMWLGPMPIRWLAQIERVTADSFVDRQVRGPFQQWEHEHRFVSIDAQTTEVQDEVTVQLHESSRWWQIVGFSMWIGLPILFAYRGWRTRRLLEQAT